MPLLNPIGGIALFTDGSCSYKDRIGGWGFVAMDSFDGLEERYGWAHDTTISRMEMQAIIEGLRYASTYEVHDVLVFSDSEYVVLGCNDRGRARKANQDLWEELDILIDRLDMVEFTHVKGHHESHWNHEADRLAKLGRSNGRTAAQS